jgi:hypothetical protein
VTLNYSTSSLFLSGTTKTGLTGNYYDISGLSANTTYYVWIKSDAVPGYTDSGYSYKSTTTLAVTKLSAPTLGTITPSSTAATVSWGAVTNRTNYTLQWSTSSSFSTTLYQQTELTATSATISGLTAGTTYYVRVKAVGSGNYTDSDYSASKNFTTPAPVLGIPQISAAVSGGNVTLSWIAVSGADKYGIWRQDVVTGVWTTLDTNVKGTAFTDTAVPGGTQLYAVRAYKGTTASGYKGVIVDVLGIPQISAAVSGSSVNVTWNNVLGAAYYGIWRQDAATGVWTTLNTYVTGVTFTDHSVPAGQQLYAVRAYKGTTASGYKGVIVDTFIPQTKAAVSGNSVNVTWAAVSGANKYAVWRQDVATGVWTTLNTNVTGVTFTDHSVPAGQQLYAVRAYKGATASGYQGVIIDTFVPQVIATPSGGNVNLTWNAVLGANKYGVWRQDAVTGLWTTLNTNVTGVTYTDTSAPSGPQLYAVRAYKGTTASGYQGVTVNVFGIPRVTSAISGSTVKLTWNAVSNTTHYAVWRQDVTTGVWTTLTTNCTSMTFTDTSAPSGQQLYAVRAYNGTTASGYNGVTINIPAAGAAFDFDVLSAALLEFDFIEV